MGLRKGMARRRTFRPEFTGIPKAASVRVSMDGNGRAPDNVFVELQAVQDARQGGVPESQVCQKYQILPGELYHWAKVAE